MERAQGFAEQGNRHVWTAGHPSSNVFQESAPFATIFVFFTGTGTLAPIYSDNQLPPTPLANPFTANANGYWFFYAEDGRYDVLIEGPFWTWTIGDVLLQDPGRWTADQNANEHWLRNLGGLTLNNGQCQATISLAWDCSVEILGANGSPGKLSVQCTQFTSGGPMMSLCADASGTLHFIDTNGNDIGSLNQAGLLDLKALVAQQIEATQSIYSQGTLGAPSVHVQCVELQNTGPSMYLCADATGTMHIRDSSGNDVASMSQTGLLDLDTLVARQIEASQSIYSLGTLGAAGDINTNGRVNALGNITTSGDLNANDGVFSNLLSVGGDITGHGNLTVDGCLNAACLNLTGGNASLHGGCLVLDDGSGGPTVFFCVDSSGTLHFRNASGADILQISQGGFVTMNKMQADEIEGVSSIWSLGLFGSSIGGTGTLLGGDGLYYAFENGVLTAITT